MTIEHEKVLSGDGWLRIAGRLCPPGATATQRGVFASKMAAANKMTTASVIHPGEILHYDTADLPFVAPPAPVKFSVFGNAILDPAGKRFIPVGANVAPQIIEGPYGFTQVGGQSAAGHAADAQALGWNTIRITVPVPGVGVSMDQTVAGTKFLIDEYTAKGIVCIVEYHSPIQNLPLASPSRRDTREFWAKLLPLVKGNTYVWANVSNEPFSQDAGWYDFSVECVNFVRAIDLDMIVVCDMSNNGQGSVASIPDMTELAANRNVVLSWHNYGAVIRDNSIGGDQAMYLVPNVGWFMRPDPSVLSDIVQVNEWLTQWAEMVKGLPVIIGEAGFDWDSSARRGNTVPRGYLLERTAAIWSLNKLTKYGFGLLAWHGTEGGIYSLRRGDATVFYSTHTEPSDMGQVLAQAASLV